MPTYQYACTECGERLEVVQAFTDAPKTECPACAGRLRKVFSAVGVVFKGSGFYQTDSRASAKSSASASSDGGSASTGDGGSSSSNGKGDSSGSGSGSTGGDAKPAAATPSGSSGSSGSSTPVPSTPSSCTAYSGNQRIGCSLLPWAGFSISQMGCLQSLWNKESGWRTSAHNPYSGAHGIPQALPGRKMAAYGSDWATNPVVQIKWGLMYIKGRYGSPCSAWAHSQSYGWY